MRVRVWLAMLIASLGWGTAGIATRTLYREGLGPYTVFALRTAVVALVVVAWMFLRRPRPGWRWWALAAAIGLANYTVSTLLFALGIQYASAGFSGVLGATIPAATAFFAHYLLPDEPLNSRKAVGLALAVGGVAALTVTGQTGLIQSGRPGLAAGLTLAGVVVAAFGGVWARRHAPARHVLDLAGPQFALGAVVLLPAMFVLEGPPTGISAAGWSLLLYLALAATLLPWLLYFWMLQRVGATTASLPTYLVTVIALAGGALLLDERVTPMIGVGAVLILAGVVFTERADRPALSSESSSLS